jgi:hypothetical protein
MLYGNYRIQFRSNCTVNLVKQLQDQAIVRVFPGDQNFGFSDATPVALLSLAVSKLFGYSLRQSRINERFDKHDLAQ